MIEKISNQQRAYAWGSLSLIPDFLGQQPTGQPAAEVWLGTHPISEAVGESGEPLSAIIGHRLSFLTKILAADQPLSIQAHPTQQQAAQGFAAENAAGIPIDAPHRNYKDDQHKPEAIIAVSDFRALCGFRTDDEILQLFEDISKILDISDGLRSIITDWCDVLRSFGISNLLSSIFAESKNLDGVTAELAGLANFDSRFELVAELNQLYPGDPGVVIALLMNQVFLAPGEALYLPAGNIHAYLSGLGIEVMAASDNVLRGGLTKKHIDVVELQRVLDFETRGVKKLSSRELARGLERFEIPVADFSLYRANLDSNVVLADLQLPAEAVAVCVAGEVAISNSLAERVVLGQGEAAYVSTEAKFTTLAGSGTLILAVGREI